MPWLQLKLTTTRHQAEPLEDALLAVGAVSVTLEDNADQPILEPALGETPLWDQVRITGLFDADIDTAAVTALLREQLPSVLPEYRWEQLEDKDWEREWMKNYHPIQCGERLWICPSWQEPPEPEKVNLMLDPGLAFGTGTHPTTFLCLEWLDRQELEAARLVDYGCGSGILGIAALLLGASHVVGVDIDPQALLATRENARRNGLPETAMPVYLPAQCPPTGVDITLANILAGPLAELAPLLSALTNAGGKICLSGILANQAEAVMAAYRPWFDFEPIAQKEEWVRITGIKR
ncbi:50S ribosomal protein L11 methyltransferase [Marinimicrobium sp. ABcell2]|uniref:50S ribosomal protein L11 methyltransferase n=1 Tax=Marinimicrobium sp. ABcell2 TaxID=3069751 RepID=UPI0027AE094E|nr:50S ribosomal protein L11 methyltransferase [Marinimicrobium sp. ABcell2]MDQ2078235.1 50S ribosomal protein L11 methyltransferase [Marinimicrobium sp. ABcell2]